MAAAVMLISCTACSGGTESSSDGSSASDTGMSSDTSSGSGTGTGDAVQSVPAPGTSVLTSDTPLDTVVVAVEGHEEMNITFGDFLKEYKYYLAGYQITDDVNSIYASTLTNQREYIANYLINEEILEVKFAELGLSLTDADIERIDSDTAAGIEGMKESLKERVKASLAEGETLTDDEIASRAEEEYTKLLADCGLAEDDLKEWQKSIVMQEKLTDHLNKDFTYEYSETEKQVATLIEDAKKAYEADNADYDPDSLRSLWIPDGSREVQHILIGFDTETAGEISTLRAGDDDAGADKLREEAVEALSDKIAEVEGKIAAGEDFASLMKEYSDDTDTSAVYIIAPGTKMYADGFAETSLAIAEIGGTDVCVTDYGYHIIKYTDDAVVTDEDIKSYTDSLHKYLEEAYLSQNFGNAMKEWRTEYTFTIDRETLMLAAEETSEA